MSGMLLSCADWPIIKQIADLLGLVMNVIYFLFDKIGIANIGLCIIVFTIIVRLAMIPMSIKQQKSMKLNSLINPEIQAIQNKYRNKRDNDSMMAMNAETKAVYQKYGTSPTGGCLPLLIQMPIILALYGVVSAIPTHVGAIGDMYTEASGYVYDSMDEFSDLNILNQIMVNSKVEGFENFEEYDKIVDAYYDSAKDANANKEIINKMLADTYARQAAGLTPERDSWGDIDILKNDSVKIAEKLKNITEEDWNKISTADFQDFQKIIFNEYAEGDIDYDAMIASINTNYEKVEDKHEESSDVYKFLGIDLSRSPAQEMSDDIWWAILIPILSALSQWLYTFVANKSNQANNAMQDNPMASSLKTMNIVMPLFSAFLCYSFASGLGLYWVIGSLFQFVQQIIINSYFKDMSVDDIVKANVAKINKKRAKKGLPPQKIANAANTNVKNIKVNTNNNTNNKTPNTSSGVTYKKGGIAAKANMVKEFNDKNTKK